MILLTALLLLALPVSASEADYALPFCEALGGQSEVTLFDRTRVDCLTDDEAIEVDYAYKWAESIGQALYYAEITGKRPAVMLIVKPGESRFIARFHNATLRTPIRLYIVEAQ